MLLGSHLEWLSNGYWGQIWLQKRIGLGLFRSGARGRGWKFSKRHPKEEYEGMDVTVLMDEKWGGKMVTAACNWGHPQYLGRTEWGPNHLADHHPTQWRSRLNNLGDMGPGPRALDKYWRLVRQQKAQLRKKVSSTWKVQEMGSQTQGRRLIVVMHLTMSWWWYT